MSRKVYKYLGPDVLSIAFNKDKYCGFKFSYPKDYNDPYELFLTIEFGDDPEIMAFYNEVIQEIPQYPTTCFSNSPVITPMWAHYAHNSKGFVIEVDEERLKEYLSDAKLDDVVYQDVPRSELTETFNRAYVRRKPRDMMFFNYGVHNAAYFTKHSCWGYELERRLVVSDTDVSTINGNMIVYIPSDCVTAIISGSCTQPKYKDKAINLSKLIGAKYFESKIGRSSSQPYFSEEGSGTYIFNGKNIVLSDSYCSSCKEPMSSNGKINCSWCAISEQNKEDAASGNSLRMLSEAGILGDYIRDFNKIGK